MLREALRLAETAEFWLVVVLDFILVASTIFSLLYAASMLARCLSPARLQPKRPMLRLVLLSALSALAACLPPGTFTADIWRSATLRMLPSGTTDFWYPRALIAFWFLGFSLRLVSLGKEIAAIRTAETFPEPHEQDPAFAAARAALGIQRTVRRKTVPSRFPVASWGLMKKTVFVPAGFSDSHSLEQRYCIYLHELIHIARFDTAKTIALSLVRSMFWFHPVVLSATRSALEDIEIACDRKTLAQKNVDAQSYARLIVESIARASGVVPGFSMGKNGVRQRLGHVLGNGGLMKHERRTWLAHGACLAALALAVWLIPPDPAREFDRAQPPQPSMTITMPNGADVTLTTTFFWHGALGTYSMMEKKD